MFDISEPITAEDPVVLVVDDTAAVRKVVSLVLKHQGFEVWAADNGRDAIEFYQELRQQDRDITVLLDVQMPGLDGPLVLAALQALYPDVRAYFMTGDAGQYREGDLLAMGGRGVFPKPFPVADAVAEFRRVLPAVGPLAPAFARAVADSDEPGAEFALAQPRLTGQEER